MAKKKNNNHNHDNNNGGGDGGDNNHGNDGEKKKKEEADGEKKKDEKSPITLVLKVDMHCEGCASKIIKCARGFDGVETVKTDIASNKITIVGSVDPSKIQDKLQQKTKKRVDLISPQVKKDKENDPKPDNKPKEKKPEDKKPKEPPVTTAVLKVVLHCQGCIEKIHKVVSKFKGVKEMSIDKQKDLITVTGTMDVKALTQCLKERLKKPVELVPPKKEKDEKESSGGGEGKKKKKGGGGDGGGNAEENSNGGGGGGGEGGGGAKMEGNRMEYIAHPGFGYGYPPAYYEYGYPVGQSHAPQMFSDENPNACSIM